MTRSRSRVRSQIKKKVQVHIIHKKYNEINVTEILSLINEKEKKLNVNHNVYVLVVYVKLNMCMRAHLRVKF